MRRVTIDDPAATDAVLVRDLRSPAGDVLARAGMRLTTRTLHALREHGIAVAFIDDAPSAGIDAPVLVDTFGRDAALTRTLTDIAGVVARMVGGAARQPTSRAVELVFAARVVPELDRGGLLEQLEAAVNTLVARGSELVPPAGLLTERQPSDDLVGHSAGVAAIAVRLGAALGFAPADLLWTGLAAALHDLGLALVPDEVRRIPTAQRTPGQQRRYQDHTVLGEALLRPLERRSPAIPLVALEHHEEQSGRGYPLGKSGGNRILRSTQQTTGRVVLVSEVVAVADRYESLVAGSVDAQALSPATARQVLADEAGARLNAEVVARFLDVVPRWPVGTEVVLHGGAHDGARAVVVRRDPEGRDRPLVRVFATPAGAVGPSDLDLARQPAVTITAADDLAA